LDFGELSRVADRLTVLFLLPLELVNKTLAGKPPVPPAGFCVLVPWMVALDGAIVSEGKCDRIACLGY